MAQSSALRLTIALKCYDRTRPLLNNEIPIEGVDPIFISIPKPPEIFWRMVTYEEFDVSEMSLSSYLIMRDQGDTRFVAIPVFPGRRFRHGHIYVRPDSPLERLEELSGKTVGIGEYQLTVGLYVRGLLEEDYGVPPDAMNWVLGREEKVSTALPHGLRYRLVPDGASLDSLLQAGSIDALIAPRRPKVPSRALLRDTKATEQDWYRRTGIFPIMHTVVLRRSLYDAYPWLARSLYKAFTEAKAAAFAEFEEFSAYSFPWHRQALEETRRIMGTDWWPYGVEANLPSLEAAIRYAHSQGLIHHPPTPQDLFVGGHWTNAE